ncbi:FAD dependent oxidoreductase [Gloeophyllum trabeum ATCC 11539]|uniref:L-2-hydroxyglutarate dehydrogenase, mitochondrial n=1 Tax=Gloeophyllum trabeum (strain ATCC 11539 / FP-39264 / Madison 617) TaxID=670483 RepID=S7QJ11_GLOTA|nr:FAD dependent oxidoreductase [Gloeophyllum trabeum ATCC 11539]EPQ59636.1 FAD dependent oxidoreductase [Gloeophyllum trabeum ATCC 11539]
MQVRGLAAALNSSGRYKYKSPEYAVDYLVVGGGVVGLAIAHRLAHRLPSKSTFLVERHSRAGEETSSRNSEVIHAGLYYPPDSLKTRLCIRGRQLIYDHCATHNIPHRKTGKLVLAHAHQRAYIENLHNKALKLRWPPLSLDPDADSTPVPTRLISGDEARELEPDLSNDIAAALWSPETGILDSHSFMESLEKDISESDSAEIVYSTKVVRVDPSESDGGWVVQTVTGEGDSDASDCLLAKTLINASGLAGPFILNALLPRERRIPMYYGRGSYASYKGPGVSSVQHLLYPCPDTAKTSSNAANFQSLGTHLTLDMDGKIRFGPDLDWISPPTGEGEFCYDEDQIDFWQKHLVPSEDRMKEMHEAVMSYLPGVTFEGLAPDYCGVRPKLVGPGGGFRDFVFRVDHPDSFLKSGSARPSRKNPMVSLLGIESPGVTSSMAIAEYVVDDILGGHEQGDRS